MKSSAEVSQLESAISVCNAEANRETRSASPHANQLMSFGVAGKVQFCYVLLSSLSSSVLFCYVLFCFVCCESVSIASLFTINSTRLAKLNCVISYNEFNCNEKRRRTTLIQAGSLFARNAFQRLNGKLMLTSRTN